MISVKYLWGYVFFGGKLQIDAKTSFEFFESALFIKPVSMPLRLSQFHFCIFIAIHTSDVTGSKVTADNVLSKET